MARSEMAIRETDEKYGCYCQSIVHRLLGNPEDEEECVNETYLRAWNSIPPNCPENLRLYLGKICRHLAIHELERRSSQKRGMGETPFLFDELRDCLPAGKDAGNQVTERMAVTEVLNRFLSELPEEHRKMFVRRYWYGCSVQEIARMHGKKDGTVAVLLHRMRKQLKDRLIKEGIAL